MSQLIIYADNSDCYCNSGANFNSTNNDLYINSLGNSTDVVRTWFPFTIPLPINTVIEQAYITVRAYATSNTEANTVRMSCEAADDVTSPASQADLYGRSISTYYNDYVLTQIVVNTEYTWQIDNPVQETLQRPGWVKGNRLAVIFDDRSHSDKPRRVYSANYSSGIYAAYLTLNFHTYVPRALGML